MMDLIGTYLIGRFVGIAQATRKDGSPVENLFSLKVDVGRHGASYERRADYWAVDRETGEATPEAKKVQDQSKRLKAGEVVAVRVKGRASGSGFVNYDIVDVQPLADFQPVPA